MWRSSLRHLGTTIPCGVSVTSAVVVVCVMCLAMASVVGAETMHVVGAEIVDTHVVRDACDLTKSCAFVIDRVVNLGGLLTCPVNKILVYIYI